MRSNRLIYPAVLAAVLTLAPINAFAQSTDAPAADDAPGSIILAQQTYIDVMANLEASGYTIVQTKTTFLGRVQIMARNAAHMREIVVSRSTGEVKRDIIVEVYATAWGSGDAAASAAAASESDASTGSGGILGALGFKANTNVSAGANGSASDGSGSDGSASGGSLSGGVSGGVSGGLGIGR